MESFKITSTHINPRVFSLYQHINPRVFSLYQHINPRVFSVKEITRPVIIYISDKEIGVYGYNVMGPIRCVLTLINVGWYGSKMIKWEVLDFFTNEVLSTGRQTTGNIERNSLSVVYVTGIEVPTPYQKYRVRVKIEDSGEWSMQSPSLIYAFASVYGKIRDKMRRSGFIQGIASLRFKRWPLKGTTSGLATISGVIRAKP
jgi:hypothetical protein